MECYFFLCLWMLCLIHANDGLIWKGSYSLRPFKPRPHLHVSGHTRGKATVSSQQITWQMKMKRDRHGYLLSDETLPSDVDSSSSSLLNKLLTQAANMIMSTYNKTTSLRGRSREDEEEVLNVAFSFSSHLTKKIHFNDSVKARWYLSLPVTEYSVLDQSLVEKDEYRNDIFHLKIPLDQIAITMDAISPNIGYRTLAKYLLCTAITVDSHPETGVIDMFSGPFAFVLNPNASALPVYDPKLFSSRRHFPLASAAVEDMTDANTTTISIPSSDMIDTDVIDPIINNTIAKIIDSGKFPTWLSWGDKETIEFMNISESNSSIVSSLQPGIAIHWTWPTQTTHASHKSVLSSFSFQKLKNFFHINNKKQDSEVQLKDELVTKLKVSVRMDMNIPMPVKLGRAISLLPVKILLQQAGSMIISSFVRNLVPYFQKMLLKDFEDRSYRDSTVSLASNTTAQSMQ